MTAAAVSAVIPVHNGASVRGRSGPERLGPDAPADRVPGDRRRLDRRDRGSGAASSATRSPTCGRTKRGSRPRATAGTELARGALVAFLDHDDTWLPTKLDRQLEALADAGATMSLCAVEVVDRRGNVLEPSAFAPARTCSPGC